MKKLSDNQHPATGRLEDVFREQFAQAEAEPRVSLWDRIEQDLDSGQVQVYKKKTVLYQRLAAACAALLLMFGAYAFYHEYAAQPVEEPMIKEQPVISEEKPVRQTEPEAQEIAAEQPVATPDGNQTAPATAGREAEVNEKQAETGNTAVKGPAETDVIAERQPEPAPAETPPANPEARPEEKPADDNTEMEARSQITVNRSGMAVTVDAPVRAAMGRTVTVRSVPCATGLFGQLWLQLENGQYLQPVENSSGKKLKEGNRYQIDYEILNGAGNTSSGDCKTNLPEVSPVKITRLKSL